MAYSRYIFLAVLFSFIFLAGCGSSRNKAALDPVAQSGTSSEEIWYQYGGARMAYTAVTRPKQLYTGYSAIRDPALYGQAPTTTQTSPKKRSRPKPAVTAPRDPNCPPCPPPDCPPCPPADANAVKTTPQTLNSQASPTFSAPAQGAASFDPSAIQGAAGVTGVGAPPPSPPKLPLPNMPAAMPAAPGT